MKLLTATREGQGERDGDFCHAVEGELVFAGFVCATDRSNPDGGCGCGRAFSGLNSLRATTTALVRDLDLTYDDVRMALSAHLVAAGMGPDVLDAADFEEMLERRGRPDHPLRPALGVGNRHRPPARLGAPPRARRPLTRFHGKHPPRRGR